MKWRAFSTNIRITARWSCGFTLCTNIRGDGEPDFREIQWAEPSELPGFDFLEADVTLVKDLAEGKLAG